MAFTLTTEQKVNLRIRYFSEAGNPATVDGAPQWFSSDDSLLTLEPAADGMSCMAVTTDTPGMVTVSVLADADMGDGVRERTDTFEINVVLPQAAAIVFTADEPVLKDEGATPAPAEPAEPAEPAPAESAEPTP